MSLYKKIQSGLFQSSNTNSDFEAVDFFKLRVQDNFKIPWGDGIHNEAFAFITKWNVLAFGSIDGNTHSIGLYDLRVKKIIASARGVHRNWIVNLLWIDKKNCLITGVT